MSAHERTEVSCTVTDDRHAFFGQRREDQFSGLTVRELLQCDRVDDLRIEMVFADVRAVLHLALVADARSHDLGESVEVVALQSQPVLYFLSHLLCPGLGTEGTDTQADILLADAQLLHRLCQIEGI